MEEEESFPVSLRRIRQSRKLTQRELAERAEVPSSIISHYERGERAPSLFTLKKLSAALVCSLDELVGMPIRRPGDALERELARMTALDRDLLASIACRLNRRVR